MLLLIVNLPSLAEFQLLSFVSQAGYNVEECFEQFTTTDSTFYLLVFT